MRDIAHTAATIKLVGPIAYDALAPYFAISDVFVIATLEDNWSLVVPEALAAGLPVLTSIYNGCWPDLIGPSTGWTFDPLNSGELAHLLQTVLRCSDTTLEAMGQAAHAHVQNHKPKQAAKALWEACILAMTHRNGRAVGAKAEPQCAP